MKIQQQMEIYKHETGATEIEMFDFEMWLAFKLMNESCENEIRQQYDL